jgi:hypothetical protein
MRMRFVYHERGLRYGGGVTEVPWWYATIAHALAVVLSVWVGLHYQAGGEWIALYAAAAVASAMLPSKRLAGAFGLIVGLGIAAAGAYLMRDARHAIVLGDIFSNTGHLLTPAREALVLVITTMWLLAASPLRFRWV